MIRHIPLFNQLDWWQRQWRGTFNLELYIRICDIKINETEKFMKLYKVHFKTYKTIGNKVVYSGIVKQVVEAYDKEHAKLVVDKQESIITKIERI